MPRPTDLQLDDHRPPGKTGGITSWLFLMAGLAMLVSVILIPPADDLAGLGYERDLLAAEERDAITELSTYATFLEALDNRDPDLIRRLALTHLNLIPDDSEAVGMIGAATDASVDHWISATLPEREVVSPPTFEPTLLRRLATGRMRLWTMLAGAVMVFIGLLPGAVRPTGASSKPSHEPMPHPA